MTQKSVIDEAIKRLQDTKKQLDTVVAYMFTHPETWTSDEVDDYRDRVQEVKDLIDELIEDIKEGYGEGYETAED